MRDASNKQSFEFSDLDAWKRIHEVVLLTYNMTKTFPRDEQFGLVSQMRRAAISAESNIAEGFGRNTARDKQHFYAMAKGSLLELQSQYLTSRDLGYLKSEEHETVRAMLLDSVCLTAGLVRSAMTHEARPR